MQKNDLINDPKANFKIYDVTTFERNICNTHIAQISRRKDNQTKNFGQLIEYNMRIFFLKNHT